MIEFSQPAALWTGLAIGLPILAHMAYQTVTRKHPFSSLRFIRPTSIPRTGRKTPSDWLLLILRILLFVLLTMLLADPYWKSGDSSSDTGEIRQTVIAIDLSPSMQGWNGLTEAKQKAKEIIQKDGFEYSLIGFSGRNLQYFKTEGKEQELAEVIDGLTHDWGKGNGQLLLDGVAKRFLEGAKEKRLIILSDFQSSDWQSAYRDLAVDGIEFELIKVGMNEESGGRYDNQAIIEARAVPVGTNQIRIWVVVRNWRDEKISVQLSLNVGAKERETKSLVLNPLGSGQAQFILPAGDFSKATVRLQDNDSFQLDDQRSLWLKSPPPRRFGFWIGNESEPDTVIEKQYLGTAVSSSGDSGWNRWEMNQDLADSLRMGQDDGSLELLFSLGTGSWFHEEGLAEFLQSFLSRGGVALLTPSEPFSASVSALKKSGLLDLSFSKVVGGTSGRGEVYRLAALSESSTLNQVFSGKASRDLYRTAFYRFGALKNLGEDLRVPIRDREDRPLAVVRNFESGGRLVLLPFRVSPSWTDLPLRNSFLPMLMELIRKGVGNGEIRTWPVLLPGETWTGREKFEAEKPGVFRFEDQWIEVISPISESSPEVISESELVEALGGRGPKKASVDLPVSVLEKSMKSLWLWFAIGVSILLIVEMIWTRAKQNQNQETMEHA